MVGEFIMFVGFPASGKTTMRRKMLERGEVDEVVSPDEIRFYDFKVQFEPSIEDLVWEKATEKVKTCLSDQKRCLLDATNTDPKRRSDLLSLADSFGAKKKAVVMNIDFDVAMARNRHRKPIYVDGVRIGQTVPPHAMFRMKSQWDATGLGHTKKSIKNVLQKEGFNEVWVINRYVDDFDCKSMGGTIIHGEKTGRKMCRVLHRNEISATSKYYYMK